MKSIFIGILVLASSIAHADCTQLEAQVIAKVGNVIAEDASTCTVLLYYSGPYAQVNSSFACPLDVDDISNGVTLQKENGVCAKAGDAISGILYKSLKSDDSRIYLY